MDTMELDRVISGSDPDLILPNVMFPEMDRIQYNHFMGNTKNFGIGFPWFSLRDGTSQYGFINGDGKGGGEFYGHGGGDDCGP